MHRPKFKPLLEYTIIIIYALGIHKRLNIEQESGFIREKI